MPTYKIRGIDVDFPFEAYECQLVYMEKVIQSLQNKRNALLESPTGTGKTLCLLCATLAWRKSLGAFSTGKVLRHGQGAGGDSDFPESSSQSSKLPTIVYTSRTHSQLRQVIQELKRSNYRPKMMILGSREQLCIHEDVSLLRGKAQTNACQHLCRKRKNKRYCAHNSRVSEFVKQNPHLGDEPVDIEDLVNMGKSFGPCPYYITKELHDAVDILFAPYNYLIDRGNRKSLKIEWNNSILIFDEAHNLESLCADAASFDLPTWLLAACISEAKTCVNLAVKRKGNSSDKSCNPDDFAILSALLSKLEKRIEDIVIDSRELGFTKPGPYIYDILSDLNITLKTSSKVIDIIEEAVELLEEDKQIKANSTACRLETMGDILKLIFREENSIHANFYRVHVQEHEAKAKDAIKGKASRTLSWWCFNPGVAMEQFSKLGVGSVILTSGTLSPMDSFAQELKLDFPIRLENTHVICSNQIWAGVVPVGPSNCALNSSYRNRDSLEYRQELGNAIANFARIVPDGLLVFFPSYYLLDQCISSWKNGNLAHSTTTWERICKNKKPVVEPRESSLFPTAIESYMAKLKDTSSSGAIFFAVCRGKVSEGLDFADQAGRAVIVIGLPYAPRAEPKVRLKREYLDEHARSQRDSSKFLSGDGWYNQQASRAVNQAIGRVIRHRHDYGAIIFCDERFAHSSSQSQVSLWIQPHIKCYSKFGDVVFTLSRFFRDAVTLPTKKLLESEKKDNLAVEKTIQPLDNFALDKFLTPTSSTDQAGVMKSFSSLIESKRCNHPSPFAGIPPANCASLTPTDNQDFNLKCSRGLIYKDRKLVIPGKKIMQQESCGVICLTSESLLDKKPNRSEMLLPCPTKKRKLLITENSLTGVNRTTPDDDSTSKKSPPLSTFSMLKSEHIQNPCDRSKANGKTELALLEKCHGISTKDTKVFTQQNMDNEPTSSPSDKKTRGAAFLTQVKEKLSTGEYKEFVGFMKALKTKAMEISHVLQSIVRLFSQPERLPLLTRFKAFVPSKYHPLYEKYLEAKDESLDTHARVISGYSMPV